MINSAAQRLQEITQGVLAGITQGLQEATQQVFAGIAQRKAEARAEQTPAERMRQEAVRTQEAAVRAHQEMARRYQESLRKYQQLTLVKQLKFFRQKNMTVFPQEVTIRYKIQQAKSLAKAQHEKTVIDGGVMKTRVHQGTATRLYPKSKKIVNKS